MDELVRKLEGLKDMDEARIAGYEAGLQRALELINGVKPTLIEGMHPDDPFIPNELWIPLAELRTRIQNELEGDNG